MTKQEIEALINAKIAGQGSAVDVGGALPQVLKAILDMAAGGENVQSDWAQSDSTKADYIKNKPSIPTAAQTLGALTLSSTSSSFESASTLSNAEAATALGISEANLEGLFDGGFIRFAYGEGGASVYSVDSASDTSVSLGKGAVVVSRSEDVYAITVA